MSKFVMVHPIGVVTDMDAMTPVAKSIKANVTTDAYWIRSWYTPDEGKLYCEWDAKDADAIRAVLAEAGKTVPQPPIEGIYPVAMVVHSEDFR